MNWTPNARNLFSELMDQDVITEHEWHRLITLLSDHANLYSALQLAGLDHRVWRYFAQQYNRTFYATREDLRVVYAGLFDHRTCLATGLLPHHKRGDEVVVLGYEPRFTRVPHPNLDALKLRVGLITPTLWRILFALAYPPALTGPLDMAEATALVTYSTTGQQSSATPEQRAEITAITRGYEFINPETHPPDPSVRYMINLPTKALFGCYPHHLENSHAGPHLVVLMAHPDNAAALAQLQEQSQMRVRAAISTQRAIDRLINAEELELRGETGVYDGDTQPHHDPEVSAPLIQTLPPVPAGVADE